MRRSNWIEVDNVYLTNETAKWARRRGALHLGPTEAWLFCWRCRRTKRQIHRTRFLQVVGGDGADELDRGVIDFVESNEAVVIRSPAEPLRYETSNAEPDVVDIDAEEDGW